MATSKKVSAQDVRIAAAPVTWNNNDLENWRPWVPFPEILDRMAEAGFTATEYDTSFGTDPDFLLAEADKRGIRYCGSYQWVDFLHGQDVVNDTSDLAETLKILQAIGVQNLIVADSLRPERVAMAGSVPLDGSASLDGYAFQRIAENVHRLGEHAARHGLRLHYHNHVGTHVETKAEVERLLELLDPALVDLCFDTGHFAFGGGDAREFVQNHISRIGYVHLKDVDGAVLRMAKTQRLGFLDALRHFVFADIGEGIADIESILNDLKEAASVPWIVIEQDTCAGDSTETASRNLRRVREIIDAHEIENSTP